MRFKRVLLINPIYDKKTFVPFIFAGLGYIAEALKQAKIEYQVIDMNLDYDVSYIIEKIGIFKPDLIGIQILSLGYHEIYDIINEIKDSKNYPNLKVVAGGGHISLFREQVLQECTNIDYGIYLEGENAIIELCKDKPINDIEGLLYANNNYINGEMFLSIRYNSPRNFVKDLDTIPFPTYEGFELDKYPEKLIHIVTSRGCPYSCGFCPVKQSIGQQLRMRTPKNVVNELEYWHNKGITHFGFVDDNFTFNRQRVIDICNEIVKRNLYGLRMLCGNGIRADKVDKEMLSLMKDVGFYNVCIGVESYNDEILKNMRKGETCKDIDNAVSLCCELGFVVGLFFIIGYPGETRKQLQNSFDFALKYPIGYANFYNLLPFPETELYNHLKSNNLLVSDYDKYLNQSGHYENIPCFSTPEMSINDRKQAFKDAKKISGKVIKKRIIRQYSHLGIIAKIVAEIMAISFVQKMFLTNPILKKIMNKFK